MSMDFPGIFSLIIKINYPHLSGSPEGHLSPPQELEVGGRRPPYLLVVNIENKHENHPWDKHNRITPGVSWCLGARAGMREGEVLLLRSELLFLLLWGFVLLM